MTLARRLPYPALLVLSCIAPEQHAVSVTSSADSGRGSFRWAVAQASRDSQVTSIGFRPGLEPIALRSTVAFSGSQALHIVGAGVVIDAAAADSTAFIATGGGDLLLEDLTVRNAAGDGVAVLVPADAEGTLAVTLRNVTLADNKGHGLLVNDQVTPDFAVGTEPDSSGSAAGLRIEITGSRFLRNGYSVSDRDGIRVNDGAGGSLTFIARDVRAEDNAGDGIELDERGSGDVQVEARDLVIVRNGKFDPADLDDGFDIDEMDDGGLQATVVQLESRGNHQDGVDFTETGSGDLTAELQGSASAGNHGVGIFADQELPGAGSLLLEKTTLEGNRGGETAGTNVRVTKR